MTKSEIIELLKPEAEEAVKLVNSKPLTTQDHYGDYMQILQMFADKPAVMLIFADAMIKAGGNTKGIMSALKIIKG